MRRLLWSAVAGLTVVGVGGCHTITEDLPTRPSQTGGNLPTIPLPVVVTPVQLPVPTTPAPSATPNPAPNNPAPAPNPTSTPNPESTNSTAPVVKVGAKVYFIECGGVAVPNSQGATSTDVGCRIHLDATPKDASNAPTQPRGGPSWTFSDPSLISTSDANEYTPTVTAKARGTLSTYCTIDGVQSNTVTIKIN